MNTRRTRYQGAIIRQDHILVIQHREHSSGRSYWLLPGGGLEPGESEEDCVQREMWEETGLQVRVDRLLLDEPALDDPTYRRMKTYLCTPLAGEAQPGYEPEPEPSSHYAISAVRWLDLQDEQSWGDDVREDSWTYPTLKGICEELKKHS